MTAPITMDVTELMSIPDTGGKTDEIGRNVTDAPEVDVERVGCPRCGKSVWEDTIGHGCDGGYRDHPQGEPGVDVR